MWLSFTFVITGNYSCLVAKFHLSRSIGFHMVQSYIPTILIVVISWVSFWMDVDSVPGRTTLGVTTLLTVSSKSAGMKAKIKSKASHGSTSIAEKGQKHQENFLINDLTLVMHYEGSL